MKHSRFFISTLKVIITTVCLQNILFGQGLDSLHVRNPDSTHIVLDKETVPAAVRSRMHELSVIHPPGFFPREESAKTGFWQPVAGPQYQRHLFLRDHPMVTRLRPGLPLRYFPEHALAGLRFSQTDTTGFPLRTHILERQEEPMVNVAVRKGDYALNDLSVSLATDLSESTHLHLSRENKRYAGVYGTEGLNLEGYYIGVQHQLPDSSQFFYDTFYAKDNLAWTESIQQTGSEHSSWYYHRLEWQTAGPAVNINAGMNIGSHRLWMNESTLGTEDTEFQRGGWINLGVPLINTLQIGASYRFSQFQLQTANYPTRTEWWHRISLHSQAQIAGIKLNGEVEFLGIYEGPDQEFYALPKLSATMSPFEWMTLKGDYTHNIATPPWQWQTGDSSIANIGIFDRYTEVRRGEASVLFHPFTWGNAEFSLESIQYQHWYTLLDPENSSILNAESNSGSLLGWHMRLRVEPLQWISLGTAYNSYPQMSQPLPGIWSRQMITSWLHVQHYFFQRNLLLHLYAENGFYLSRQPVGWDPTLQSLTYYPGFGEPSGQYYLHFYVIGEIGSFTISGSFYNILSEIEYAVNQRLQYPVFFLGVRWQFWN